MTSKRYGRASDMEHSEPVMRTYSLQNDLPEEISALARALSVPQRIRILRLLGEKNIMSVNDIANALELPLSTVSLHVHILEEAGLVVSERMPSIHGTLKLCTRRDTSIVLNLCGSQDRAVRTFEQETSVGSYSSALKITPPCGMASLTVPIGVYNNPKSFYLPARSEAEILWIRSGVLIYDFAPLLQSKASVLQMEISFEVGASAQLNQLWETCFTMDVNGFSLGSAVAVCEKEGRRGWQNPDWWPDIATQHGSLFRWKITKDGTWMGERKVSDTKLDQLLKDEKLSVRLTVPDDPRLANGINLFGRGFGDFDQGIRLSITYRETGADD